MVLFRDGSFELRRARAVSTPERCNPVPFRLGLEASQSANRTPLNNFEEAVLENAPILKRLLTLISDTSELKSNNNASRSLPIEHGSFSRMDVAQYPFELIFEKLYARV